MPVMHVDATSLNMRSGPKVMTGNIVASLPLAHRLTVSGPINAAGFQAATTVLGGQNLACPPSTCASRRATPRSG